MIAVLITMKLISLHRAGGVGRGDGRDRGGDEEGAQWRVFKVETIFQHFLGVYKVDTQPLACI